MLADPFLQPFWRHERVLGMLEQWPPERCKRYDDEWVQGYRTFLFKWNKGGSQRNELLHINPGLFYAYKLFLSRLHDPELSLIIEARLLAGMSYGDIAHENKTMPETIAWYEKLFFNVTDFLAHHDWILRNILLPASDRSVDATNVQENDKAPKFEVKPHFDMTLKFFAYYGGPILCDFMLSGFKRNQKLTDAKDIDDWLDQQWANQIRRKSAQAAGQLRVNSFNVMELFITHGKLIEVQKNIESRQDRHNEFEKHVNAMLTELPWNVGAESEKLYAQTALGRYDKGAAELDSAEIMAVGANSDLPNLDVVDETVFRRTEIKDGKAK
jgi:hypothetical protein